MRFVSPEEIRSLADRMEARAVKGVMLSPETTRLVVAALRAFASRPHREEILAILCPHCEGPRAGACINCIGKANQLERLIEGRRETTFPPPPKKPRGTADPRR